MCQSRPLNENTCQFLLQIEAEMLQQRSNCLSHDGSGKLSKINLPWLDFAPQLGETADYLLKMRGLLQKQALHFVSNLKQSLNSSYNAVMDAIGKTQPESVYIGRDSVQSLFEAQAIVPGNIALERAEQLCKGLLFLIKTTGQWPLDLRPQNLLLVGSEVKCINSMQLEENLHLLDKESRAMQPLAVLEEEECQEEMCKAWMLACVLLYIFVGRQPFLGKSVRQIDNAIAEVATGIDPEADTAGKPASISEFIVQLCGLFSGYKRGREFQLGNIEIIINNAFPKTYQSSPAFEQHTAALDDALLEIAELKAAMEAQKESVASIPDLVRRVASQEEQIAQLQKANREVLDQIDRLRKELEAVRGGTIQSAGGVKSVSFGVAALGGPTAMQSVPQPVSPCQCFGTSVTLIQAAEKGCLQCCKRLIGQAGAVDQKKATALMKAAANGSLEIIKLLLPLEKRLQNKKGWAALFFAVQYTQYEAIKLLRMEEADIRDFEGMTALDWARKAQNPMATSLLQPVMAQLAQAGVLRQGVPRRLTTENFQENPIDGDCACQGRSQNLLQAAANNCRACAAQYLDQSGNVDSQGNTAMIIAAQNGYEDVVRMLMSYEAGLVNDDGLSALGAALKARQFDVARYLAREQSEWLVMSEQRRRELVPFYNQLD